MRVAFIGLGNMGLGMAHNLLKAGIATTVFDVRDEAVKSVVSAGATKAARKLLGRSGPRRRGVRGRVQRTAGPRRGDRHGRGPRRTGRRGTGHGHRCAQHGFPRGLVKELAAAADERRVFLIDVAMTGGGDVAAAEGNLTFMVGGSGEALAKARPALDAMARTVFHIGPLGAGVSAKIISNYLGTSNVALVREALRMAAAAGIAEKEILRIIQDGGVGSSWVSNNWQHIRTQEENYTTGKEGMVEMWSKDLKLAQNLAAVNGVPAPIVDFIVANVLPEVGANGLTG